jgi:hypothetical protein
MKFSFSEEAKKAEGGSYFKIKEGNNNIRIVTEFLLYESSYQGRPTKKFVGFIIDRADGGVKPAFLAKTIIDQIADLQMTEDYGFDGVPMPYDVNIKATGAGTKEVQYTVIAARANVPLSEVEQKAIADLNVQEFLLELVQKQSEVKAEETTAVGSAEVTTQDIPM